MKKKKERRKTESGRLVEREKEKERDSLCPQQRKHKSESEEKITFENGRSRDSHGAPPTDRKFRPSGAHGL